MKPLHSKFKRLSRCPCCQTVYSASGMRKKNDGKSAARQAYKRDLNKDLGKD